MRNQFLTMVIVGCLAGALVVPTVSAAQAADPVFIRITVESAQPADQPLRVGLSVYQRPWQHLVFAAVHPDGRLKSWKEGGSPDWTTVPESAAIRPGQSTPWIDLTALMAELKGGAPSGLISEYYHKNKMIKSDEPKTLSLSFTAPGLPARPRDRGYYGNIRAARLRVEFATAPDAEHIVRRIDETVENGVLGIWFPLLHGNLTEYAGNAQSMYVNASRRLAALEKEGLQEVPAARRLLLSSWVKVGPFAYDFRAAMVEAKLLRLLGLNVLKDFGTSHSVGGWCIPGINEAVAEANGFKVNYQELSGPPKAIRNMANPDARKEIAQWMRPSASTFFSVTGIQPGEPLHLKIEDEPHLMGVNFQGQADEMLADPRLAVMFRDWLRNKGFTPADVGANDWSEVRPYEQLHRLVTRAEVPDDTQARRYVQTVWFLQDSTAQFYKSFSDAGREVYGSGTVTNTCIPYITYRAPYFTFAYRPDYFLWSRLGVMGIQNHHFSRNKWQTAEENLLVGEFIRSASHFGLDQPGALWALSGPSTASIDLMGTSALIRGIGNFYQYYYSPIQERVDPQGTNFAGSDETHRFLASMGRTYHLATRIEDYLLDGRRPARQVAYLHSRAGELWYKPGVYPEVRMLAGALSYINAPYDVLPEEEAAAHLKDYKVLYVLSPNLSKEAFAALRQWVQDGGVLVCTAGSLKFDELDRPADYFQQLVGTQASCNAIGPEPAEYLETKGLSGLPAGGQFTWTAGDRTFTTTAYGRAESIQAPGAEVSAKWADGSAAAVAYPVGKGQVIRYGFAPGTLLARSAVPAFTDPVQDDARQYDDQLLSLYAYPLERAGIARDIRLSQRGIDAGFFELESGAVVLLADYRSLAQDSVDVAVRLKGNFTTCQTVDGKSLNVRRDADGYTRITGVPLAVTQALFLR